MPFTFSPKTPLNTGRVSTDEIPLGTYLSNSFSQGMHDSMFGSIMDMSELDLEREGRRMPPNEANEMYGIPGQLVFDRYVYESEARVMRERKDAEMRRAFYLELGAPGGLWSKRGLAGLGAGFVGSVLNPLDLSVNFLPIVGSESVAAEMGALGASKFRQGLARGLITEEAIARSVPVAPKLASSMIQGSVGSLVAEVPHLISALESKENYTIQDSITNVVAGGALAGALHLGITQAVKIYERLRAHTKETMLRTATDQFLKGQDIEVAKFVHIDEGTIRESVKFDETQARERALQGFDIEQVRAAIKERYNETPVKAAFKLTDGRVLTGDAHFLIDVADLRPEDFNGLQEGFVTDKGRFVSREEAAELVGQGGFDAGGEPFKLMSEQVVQQSDPDYLVPEDRVIFDAVKEAGATDAEAMGEVRRIQKERADAKFFERPDIIQKVEDETQRRVQELVESERQKYDENGKFIAARDAEIQRQIREGRVLTPEQAKEWDLSEKTQEQATATIKEQNQALMEELKDLAEGEEVETSKVTSKSALDKIEDVVKKLKIEGDGLREGLTGMPVWLWNGAVDAVIAAIRAGKKIEEAIQAGIKHLRDKRKDFELTEKVEQQFARKIRKQLGVKQSGVSRRSFIDLVAKVTGAGVTTPMGVVKAAAEGLAKTEVSKAVKKTLLPNISFKQLRDFAEAQYRETFNSIMAIEDERAREYALDKLAMNPINEFTPTEGFLPFTLEEMLRESVEAKGMMKSLTPEQMAHMGFEGDPESSTMWIFTNPDLLMTESAEFDAKTIKLFGADYSSRINEILRKFEETPLAELDINEGLAKNLASQVADLATIYPEVRSMIDMAAGAVEAKIVKDVVGERVKSESEAIEQALRCLIINT